MLISCHYKEFVEIQTPVMIYLIVLLSSPCFANLNALKTSFCSVIGFVSCVKSLLRVPLLVWHYVIQYYDFSDETKYAK